MYVYQNVPAFLEVGLTMAAFAACAWAAGGPLAGAVTAVLVLVAIHRGGQGRRAARRPANDSPAAIDMAPATSPATPAMRTSEVAAEAAATPTIRLAVETMPSLAPSTAARSQPMRETKWLSGCR